MTTKYNTYAIETILDSSEDEHIAKLMGKDDDTRSQAARRESRSWFERHLSSMSDEGKETKESKDTKERKDGKEKKKHRNTNTGSKHQPKSKSKATSGKKSARELEAPRPRRRRQSTSSTSSSEDDEQIQDHREVLAAARGRLTSPSVISSLTVLTNATNNSGGSSGSNSTVTQASITKRSNLGTPPVIAEAPLSPAVPDAPDVFAFLDNESILEKDVEETQVQDHSESESESEGESDQEGQAESKDQLEIEEVEYDEDSDDDHPSWPPGQQNEFSSSTLPHISQEHSSSSSASSSFHGEDDLSSPIADNETDRSTSPERSVKDHDSEHEGSAPTDPVSVKIASQMAAAQQRQNRYDSLHPNLQRVNTSSLPQTPSSAMTPRFNHQQIPQPQSPAGIVPESGYEQLAMRLSSRRSGSDDGATIKPIYRKFEALNHRVLLYLQDEISELEEILHRIDQAETQSRRTDRQIIPASRRAAVQAGGEIQWHKTDILGKIGYKLSQYNQALSSFNTTQSLNRPDPEDISAYRTYLSTENPIAEAETHFLDPTDDLVSVYSENLRPPPFTHRNRAPSSATSAYSTDAPSQSQSQTNSHSHSQPSTFPPSPIPFEINTQPNALTGLATAIGVSILVPLLTFNVIPNFIGRLTVTLLVAVGVVWALVQSEILRRGALLGRESLTCAGIYGGIMVIMAGII